VEIYRWKGRGSPKVGEVLEGNIYPCAYCRGTGKSPKTNTQCPICRGDGFVSVRPPVVRCAYCRGTGVGQSGTILTCQICRGKGVVEVKEPIKVCPTCRGTGRSASQLSCLTCRGKGVVEVKE